MLTVQKCQLSLCLCPFVFAKLPHKDLRTPCSAPQLSSFPNKLPVCIHSNCNSTPSGESSGSSKFSSTVYFFMCGLIGLSYCCMRSQTCWTWILFESCEFFFPRVFLTAVCKGSKEVSFDKLSRALIQLFDFSSILNLELVIYRSNICIKYLCTVTFICLLYITLAQYCWRYE